MQILSEIAFNMLRFICHEEKVRRHILLWKCQKDRNDENKRHQIPKYIPIPEGLKYSLFPGLLT